ncbi:MAG TPA: glucose 1-dehydrogenase [Acidimicrobiales bacterium]|nr:glucose 1-dehydrogenase [Acidimicrobiales bacterium]
MGRVEGKVAIVTGAASGIGRATAERLASEGARVVVADVNGPGAKEVAAAIGEDRAIGVAADVSDEDQVRAMVDAAVSTFGGLHILHNNAAITSAAHMARDGDVTGMDVSVLDATLSVILRGAVLGCKHAIPRMIESGGGSIINTSSNSSLGGDVVLTAYTAAKGGINSITRSVATQFGKQGIRCNAISPGTIMTPSVASNVPKAVQDIMERNNLVPRLGLASDVANLVLFLASDESAYITGQVIVIDGGTSAHHAHISEMLQLGATTTNQA